MSPQETRSRQYKRALAIAGATIVAAGGAIGLAFAASSDDSEAVAAKPVTTARRRPPRRPGRTIRRRRSPPSPMPRASIPHRRPRAAALLTPLRGRSYQLRPRRRDDSNHPSQSTINLPDLLLFVSSDRHANRSRLFYHGGGPHPDEN